MEQPVHNYIIAIIKDKFGTFDAKCVYYVVCSSVMFTGCLKIVKTEVFVSIFLEFGATKKQSYLFALAIIKLFFSNRIKKIFLSYT